MVGHIPVVHSQETFKIHPIITFLSYRSEMGMAFHSQENFRIHSVIHSQIFIVKKLLKYTSLLCFLVTEVRWE